MNPYEILSKIIGNKQPIDQSTITAATGQPVRTRIAGNDPSGWMSPHQPIEPQEQQVAGRQFDYPVGVNLQYTPRGTEPISFQQLRALADSYDLLRILIETRKDQLVKFKWQISPINEKKVEPKADERCAE